MIYPSGQQLRVVAEAQISKQQNIQMEEEVQ